MGEIFSMNKHVTSSILQGKKTELQQQLFTMQDLKYRDFQSKLLPGIEKETIIGIRTPVLRKFAKEFGQTEEAQTFLKKMPHHPSQKDFEIFIHGADTFVDFKVQGNHMLFRI